MYELPDERWTDKPELSLWREKIPPFDLIMTYGDKSVCIKPNITIYIRSGVVSWWWKLLQFVGLPYNPTEKLQKNVREEIERCIIELKGAKPVFEDVEELILNSPILQNKEIYNDK
jgi:hypothetical protein